jgi:hypothetical protein
MSYQLAVIGRQYVNGTTDDLFYFARRHSRHFAFPFALPFFAPDGGSAL